MQDSSSPPVLDTRFGRVRGSVLVVCAIAILLVSRWLAFPASIWDMDEANFALGVLEFDPVHNQPHAPFFPLWIALGVVVRWMLPAVSAAGALQLVGAAFSIAVALPLVSLWSSLMPRTLAWAATALYVFLPGVWLLSGRAYTEPAATMLLLTTISAWLPDVPSRRRLAAGGVALAAALLIRPQWLPVVVPLVVWRVFRARGLTDRSIVIAVPAVLGTGGIGIVALRAGGLAPVWAAVTQHRAYMASAGQGFEWGFADLGMHAVAGGVAMGTVWLILAAFGWAMLLRRTETRRRAGVVCGLVLVPLVALLVLAQNPTLPRYALPVMALTSGAVVASVRAIVRSERWALVTVAAWVFGSVVATVPALGVYHDQPSPVVAAFDRVGGSSVIRAVAADRRLVAFVALEQARGRLQQQLVWDYQVELGMVETRFRPDLAAITTSGLPSWVTTPGTIVDFSCRLPILRSIASPRFLDITVIEGCGLAKPADPSIRPEDLRPGSVIPAS